MADFSVCPPCSLTDIGAELKKPNVSLQSSDQAKLCSPRKEGNWEVGGRGREGGGREREGGREGGREEMEEGRGVHMRRKAG